VTTAYLQTEALPAPQEDEMAAVTEPSFGVLGCNGEKSLPESLLQGFRGARSHSA
jgi:hypothetical protein